METQPGHTRPISRGKQSMDSTSGSGRMNKLIWSCSYDRRSYFWVSFSSNQRRNIDPVGEVKQIPDGVALVPVQGTRLVANHHLDGVHDMVAVGFTPPALSLWKAFIPSVKHREIESDVPLFEDDLESVRAFQECSWPLSEDQIFSYPMTKMMLSAGRLNWNPVLAVACLVGSCLHVSLHNSAKTRVVVGSATESFEIDSSKSIWLSPGDRYIIMGTPGLWKWLTAVEAVSIVRHCDTPHDASVSIVQAAVDRMKERRSLVLEMMKDRVLLGISKLVTLSFDEPTFDYNNPSDITVTVIFIDHEVLERLNRETRERMKAQEMNKSPLNYIEELLSKATKLSSQQAPAKIEAGLKTTSVGIQAPVTEDIRPSDLICCFNKEAKHFEFYFKNSETMARIIGVGVEYAKVLISDHGMKVRAIEIPKEDWESMWKYDEGLPPQIWENKLESVKVLSADGEAWRPLLWYIAEYCKPKLETMMSSSKDTQTDAENSASRAFGSDGCSSEGKDNCDASRKNEVQDGAGAGGAGGRNGGQLGRSGGGGGGSKGAQVGESGGNGSGSNRGQVGGSSGDGNGSNGAHNGEAGEGAPGGSSNGGHTKATVELELLPGGQLYDSEWKVIDDNTKLPLREELLVTIRPILTFTFMRDESNRLPRTEIETIVKASFELPGVNSDNYTNIQRFGWWHTYLEVSFGVEGKKATLDTSKCKPLDFEEVTVTSKVATTSTLSNDVENSKNLGGTGGAFGTALTAGYGKKKHKLSPLLILMICSMKICEKSPKEDLRSVTIHMES
ncbi:hypothetical protein KC19_8G179500 [Ceratodon purpureus]|uniref:Uncharacterized protein n=1 Tax=Ceratodon purpureus TaxID=3225 RepID=A0A8T0H1S4_CERPU|nr:hypothetical protein KC19_8G179500 [Ceratodon purpureus]